VRCVVKNEYRRFVWKLNTSSPSCYSPPEVSDNFDTEMRVAMKLRHRYAFRHDEEAWRLHDNLCRLLPRMPSNYLVQADFRSHVEIMESRQSSQIFRVVAGVKNFWLTDIVEEEKPVDYEEHRLAMQNWLFPLVPGCLHMLEKQSKETCARILEQWGLTVRSAHPQTRSVDVREFLPARPAEQPHLRLVLQITHHLLHGVRVLYVQRDNNTRECLVHADNDFVSFWAHDGHHELAFSTDCPSFMLMLDQALFQQEHDEDFQIGQNMDPSHDVLRTFVGDSEPNVLANYIVSCSVHDVSETAHMGFTDVFGEVDEYTTVMHEQRLFDFVLLDTKIPFRNFIQQIDEMRRNNQFSSHGLRQQLLEENARSENDTVIRSRQDWRCLQDISMPRWRAIDHKRIEHDSADDEDEEEDEARPTQPYVAPALNHLEGGGVGGAA